MIWTVVQEYPTRIPTAIQIDMLILTCTRIPPVILITLILIEWIVTMGATRVIHRTRSIPTGDRGMPKTTPMIAIEKRNHRWKTSEKQIETLSLSIALFSKPTSRRDDSSSFKRNSSQQQYTSGSHHANNDYVPPHPYNNRRADDWHDPWDR